MTRRMDDPSRRWRLVSGDRLRRFRLARLGNLVAQLDQAEQDFVAFRREFVDRARSDLGMNTIDQFLLDFGCQLRGTQHLPPGGHGSRELLEEMFDAALAATEMIEQHLAHDAPAQTGSPAQCGVDIDDADDAVGDEMVDLPRQRGLQTVRYMPRHFLVQADSSLAEARVKFGDALDRILRRLCSADNLDQRDQMRDRKSV